MNREETESFCRKCDYLGKDGMCTIVRVGDQKRYAERGWCGWSSIDGIGVNTHPITIEIEGIHYDKTDDRAIKNAVAKAKRAITP